MSQSQGPAGRPPLPTTALNLAQISRPAGGPATFDFRPQHATPTALRTASARSDRRVPPHVRSEQHDAEALQSFFRREREHCSSLRYPWPDVDVADAGETDGGWAGAAGGVLFMPMAAYAAWQERMSAQLRRP